MAEPSSLWNGIKAAFFGIIASIILLIAFGFAGEGMVSAFETTNVIPAGSIFNMSAPWDMAYADVEFYMSLLYVVCIAPALLGIIIMFLSAIKTQEYDVFADDAPEQYDAGGYGGQSVSQNITAEEIAFYQSQGGK